MQAEHHRGEAQLGKDRGQDRLPAVPGDVPGGPSGPEGNHELPADGKLRTNTGDCHCARGGSALPVAHTSNHLAFMIWFASSY